MSRLVRLIPWIALLGISLASGFGLRTAHFPRLSLVAFLLAAIFLVSGLTVEYWEHLRRMRLRKPWLVLPHEHDRIPQGPMYELEIAHKEIWDSFNEFEAFFLELKELLEADDVAIEMVRKKNALFPLTERTPLLAKRDIETKFIQARKNLYMSLADFKTTLFWKRQR
jgi:hypothetical protein